MDLGYVLNNNNLALQEFKRKVNVLSKEQSDYIRNKYIEIFIDKEKEYYKKRIKTLKECVDGKCYTGYLWDCLKSPIVVSFEKIKNNINKLENIYVMWDIHSKEQIFIEDYWKFGKSDVIYMNPEVLINNLGYLPEDIYIFDKNFNQTFILTHEHDDNH